MRIHARTHTLSPPPAPTLHGLATHPLLTPQQHSRAANEEQRSCARHTHTLNTRRTTRDSLYTQSPPRPPFYLYNDMDCDPAPPFPLFYRDLFILSPLLAEANSVNTLPRPVCESGRACERSVCVCVRAIQHERMACVFVTLYVFVQV